MNAPRSFPLPTDSIQADGTFVAREEIISSSRSLVSREEVLNDYRNEAERILQEPPPLPFIRSNFPKCLICDDPIKPGWIKSENDPQLCDKKSCWEKFLPRDMAKKYFPPKDRYQILKEQNKCDVDSGR